MEYFGMKKKFLQFGETGQGHGDVAKWDWGDPLVADVAKWDWGDSLVADVAGLRRGGCRAITPPWWSLHRRIQASSWPHRNDSNSLYLRFDVHSRISHAVSASFQECISEYVEFSWKGMQSWRIVVSFWIQKLDTRVLMSMRIWKIEILCSILVWLWPVSRYIWYT